MKLRITEVAKSKDVDLQTLAKKLGITYQALYARMVGNPSIKIIQTMADALGVEPAELVETGSGYAHFYDDKTGEWLGIRKK